MSKTETQRAYDNATTLYHQASALYTKLFKAQESQDDAGLEFSWRLSDLMNRAYARCNRRYKKVMSLYNQLRPIQPTTD